MNGDHHGAFHLTFSLVKEVPLTDLTTEGNNDKFHASSSRSNLLSTKVASVTVSELNRTYRVVISPMYGSTRGVRLFASLSQIRLESVQALTPILQSTT